MYDLIINIVVSSRAMLNGRIKIVPLYNYHSDVFLGVFNHQLLATRGSFTACCNYEHLIMVVTNVRVLNCKLCNAELCQYV